MYMILAHQATLIKRISLGIIQALHLQRAWLENNTGKGRLALFPNRTEKGVADSGGG